MSRGAKDMLINVLLVALIVGIYAWMQQLEAPADRRAEWAESEAAQLAINNEAARARFARAATQMCGNADYLTLDDKTIQCLPRKGPVRAGAVVQLAQGGAL